MNSSFRNWLTRLSRRLARPSRRASARRCRSAPLAAHVEVVEPRILLAADIDLAPSLDGFEGTEISHTETAVFDLPTVDADGETVTYAATLLAPDPVAVEAFELDQRLDVHSTGNLWEDYYGLGEKWLQSDSGWLIVLPNGEVHTGTSTPMDATRLATLNGSYHADPDRLYEATLPMAFRAAALDEAIDVRSTGNLWEDYYGLGEKWLQSDNGWLIVLPNGEVHEATQTPSDESRLVTLDATYHADPSALYDAEPLPTSATGGTVVVSGSHITVDPADGFTGRLTLEVVATDGRNVVSRVVTINVGEASSTTVSTDGIDPDALVEQTLATFRSGDVDVEVTAIGAAARGAASSEQRYLYFVVYRIKGKIQLGAGWDTQQNATGMLVLYNQEALIGDSTDRAIAIVKIPVSLKDYYLEKLKDKYEAVTDQGKALKEYVSHVWTKFNKIVEWRDTLKGRMTAEARNAVGTVNHYIEKFNAALKHVETHDRPRLNALRSAGVDYIQPLGVAFYARPWSGGNWQQLTNLRPRSWGEAEHMWNELHRKYGQHWEFAVVLQ